MKMGMTLLASKNDTEKPLVYHTTVDTKKRQGTSILQPMDTTCDDQKLGNGYLNFVVRF